MSAERGLEKIMRDPDTREWLWEVLHKGGLFDSSFTENRVYTMGRAAIRRFVDNMVQPIREHHHGEFLEMQKEARQRLESKRIEAAKLAKKQETEGRQMR